MQNQTPREPQPHGDADEWAEISSAWPKRDFRVLHQTVERLPGVPVTEIDALFDDEPAPDDAAVTAVLRDAFKAAGSPENRVRVALYVYARCLDTWERSTEYGRIRRVLTALKPTATDFQAGDGAAGELLGIVVRQACAVSDEMAVESGVNCSCPVETGDRAQRVAREMRAIRRRLGPDVDGPAKVLRDDARRQRLYFEAVSDGAAAVEGLVDPDRAARITVEEALRKLERNETNEVLRDDVYASELRAHRLTLSELAKAENRRRLHVDSAHVVYVYPFALEGFDAAKVDGLVSQRLSLGGFGKDIEVHALALTDLWDRPDHAAEFGYGGVSIALPPVRATTTARVANELDLDAEVRLSRLGNHHLRVRSELKDATLHDVNQALRRGSRNMGEEKFESAGDTWTRLTDYAGAVIEAVAKAFGATAVGDPRASFHVALASPEISVRQSRAEPRRATLTDLKQAVGASLLFHPVPGLATALEDWVRYPSPEVRNLLPTAGYEGELVARTANTTVLYMPYSPDWRTAGYLEMIEFVASVPPLLMLWERQATAHAQRLENKLGELKSGNVDADELHLLEAEVRQREAEIRQDLGFFHSPALCRDRSQRDFIDALWDAAGMPALEAELDRRLAYLSGLHERVSTIAAAIAERVEQARARRIELSFQLLGTFLAVASVAEVFSWLNGGFGLDHWLWTIGEIVLLLAVAAAVWVIVRIARRSDVNLIVRNLRDERDDELISRFYVEVLQPSFDQDELMDVDALARGVRGDDDPRTLASVAVDDRGTVLGGIVAELYESVGVLLLAYLAVRPGMRGRGVGTALAERVVPAWFADPRVAIAIGEVHDPRFWPGDTADERLRLYGRLGGRVLAVPFVQPALGVGASRVRGFLLLAFHVDPRAHVVVDGHDAVRADLLARFVRRYFAQTEGARPPYDAELAGLLELIERDEGIPLLPVADYGRVPALPAASDRR